MTNKNFLNDEKYTQIVFSEKTYQNLLTRELI